MPHDDIKPLPRLDIDALLSTPAAAYDDAVGRRVHAAVDEARRGYERAGRLLNDLINGDLQGPSVVRGHGGRLLALHERRVRQVVAELQAGVHALREAVATAHGTTARPTARARVAGDDEE